MTNARKLKANRANAQLSTGPKSAQGKAHAAKNARRHGLNIPILIDPTRSAEVESVAQEIARQDTNPETLELARRIAEPQIDLVRIRQAREQLVARALSRSDAILPSALSKESNGARKVFHILPDIMKQLIAMDRYERRARSRRKFAIRAFDRARREHLTEE